jgi:hypothetical protein
VLGAEEGEAVGVADDPPLHVQTQPHTPTHCMVQAGRQARKRETSLKVSTKAQKGEKKRK